LVSRRNVSSEEAARVCGSRLFHARAAATGNARSPRVDRRVDGTSIVGESTERIDGDEQQPLMSAAGCQPDTPVLCRAHSDTPEHTAGTGFTPGRVASAALEAVESCALTSDVSRRVERRHLARTDVGLADIE